MTLYLSFMLQAYFIRILLQYPNYLFNQPYVITFWNMWFFKFQLSQNSSKGTLHLIYCNKHILILWGNIE